MRPTLGDLLAALLSGLLAAVLWFGAIAASFWLVGEVYGWWDWWRAVL